MYFYSPQQTVRSFVPLSSLFGIYDTSGVFNYTFVDLDPSTGAGWFLHNGVRATDSSIMVWPWEMDQWSYYTGYSAGTQEIRITASNSTGQWGSDQTIVVVDNGVPNFAPLVSASANAIYLPTLADFNFQDLGLSAYDYDGFVVSYRFSDTTPGTVGGWIELNGGPNPSVTVAADNLGAVSYNAGTFAGTNVITVEAIDGEGAVSQPFQLTVNVSNQSPVIFGPAGITRNVNQSFSFVGTGIGATDADGSVAQFVFTDSVAGAGYLTIGGARIQGTSVTVAAADFGRVGYATDAFSGSNAITIQAIDNVGAFSNSLNVLITVANTAPTVTGPAILSKSVNQTFDLTSLFRASDPDGTVAYWSFADPTPGPEAYLTKNGSRVDSTTFAANYLGVGPYGNIGYYTGTSPGTNMIEVWATDNLGLSSTRLQLTITTVPNTAPTITGPAKVTMGLDDWINFAPLITASDVDGEVTQYRFTDSYVGGGQLTYNGGLVSGTSLTVSAADMWLVGYLSGPTASSNTIAIEAIDTVNAVSPGVLIMTINAAGNQAPTISGPSSVTWGTNWSYDQTDAIFASLITAADADGTVVKYRFTDSTPGAGYLTVNGAQVGSALTVSAADLGQVGYTTGSSAGLEVLSIEAIDDDALAAAMTMTIVVDGDANKAPTISGPASVDMGTNQIFTFSTTAANGNVVLDASDADGAVAKFRFSDATPGAGSLVFDHLIVDSPSITVPAADLELVKYYSGRVAGSNSIVIEAIDDQGLASSSVVTMTIIVSAEAGTGNQAPTINGPASVSTGTNEYFTFGTASATGVVVLSASDVDGTVEQYRFWDNMPGAGYLSVNNGQPISGASVTVSAAELGQVRYYTGASGGSNSIAIEAIDNLGLSSPSFLTMTINVGGTTSSGGTAGTGGTTNQTPTISGPASVSKTVNESFTFTSLISASDADGSVAQYRFSDGMPGAGNLTLNGTPIPGTSVTISAANLDQVGYSTGASTGSNSIAIEAIDNLGLASPSLLTMTINVAATLGTGSTGGTGTVTNQAPTIAGPASIGKSINQTFDFTALISASDADGSVAQYRFWDSTAGAGSLTLNGAVAPSVFTVAASNLWQVGYSTGMVAGSNSIAIEAIDNLGLASPNIVVTTINVGGTTTTGSTGGTTNQAPIISGQASVSKTINESFNFTSLISASDSDGTVAQYRFSDYMAGAGHLTLNGLEIAGNSVTVSAADLAKVGYDTGAFEGSNSISIEAIDNLGRASPTFLLMTIGVHSSQGAVAADASFTDTGQGMGVYQGRASGYIVDPTATGYSVTIKSGAFPKDTLLNMERVLFDDLAPYGDGSTSVVNAQARTIDGGTGIDTLAIHGSISQYTIMPTATGYTISNAIQDSQWVTNVERLMFNDGMVALDIQGDAGMAYRLYQAAFDRTPDLGGLGFQMTALDNGLKLVQVAANFIASPEFQSTYGTLTNEQFVRQLYANVLHREADVEGYAYHVNHLYNGFTRADVLVGFSESPENKAALVGVMQDGMSYTL